VPTWPQYLAALKETLDRLESAGKTIVLVGPAPWPGYNSPSRAARELAFRGRLETPLEQSRATYDARFGPVEAWLDTVGTRITVIRPSSVLCDWARCSFEIDGKPAYFDDNHLSLLVMGSFEPLFAQALDKAVPPSKRVD